MLSSFVILSLTALTVEGPLWFCTYFKTVHFSPVNNAIGILTGITLNL